MTNTDNATLRPGPSRPNIIFGLLLVLFGLTFLLHNLGVHYFEEFWRFWPVALIVLGLAKAFGGPVEERTLGWILIFIGSVFFARFVLGWDIGLGELWPIIVIIIGVSIVTKSIRGPRPPRPGLDASSTVHERAFVGGVSRKNSSQTFQGGELTSVMGGCEIDLREARMAGPTAVIDCFTMWGGLVIQIPADWVVDPHVSVFAAGLEDQTRPPLQPAGRLILRGTAIMGGIEIKN